MNHQPTGRRRLIAAPALLTVSLLALTACGGGSGTAPTTPAPTNSSTSASTSASASPSVSASSSTNSSAVPTSTSPSASETGAAAGIDLDQDVPGEPPVVTQYDGEMRPLAEIHHMECLEAAAGDEEVPEVETGDQSNEQDGLVINAWTVTEQLAVPADWKFCVNGTGGYLVVPSSFTVTVEKHSEAGLQSAVISDGGLVSVATFTEQVSKPSYAQSQELTVLDVADAEYIHTEDSVATEHLRTAVAQQDGEPVLRIEFLSVPVGEDPESADLWGFGPVGDQRSEYYASIPLSSADQAQEVMDSPLYTALTQMLRAYQPTVQ